MNRPREAISVVLAALTDTQRSRVEASLRQANSASQFAGRPAILEYSCVQDRGIHIIEQAADADVVLFQLEDELLPGEASHIVATYPDIKIIGLDDGGHVRIVLGAVTEPLSNDLPTVIRWITRRGNDQGTPRSW